MKKILGILLLLLAVCLLTTFYNGRFLLSTNLENNLRWTSLFALIGIGVSFVIVTGGIDLSIGSVIALTGCLLPMFLSLQYVDEPDNASEVAAVDLDAKTLELTSPLGLRPHDHLKFANAQVLTVSSESPADAGRVQVRVLERPTPARVGGAVFGSRREHMNVTVAVTLVLLLSALIGLTHGLLVTRARLQPFVVTLCGLMIYRGLARVLANDEIQGFGTGFEGLKYLAKGKPFSIPVPFIQWVSEGGWSRWKHDIRTGQPIFDAQGEAIPLNWIEWVSVPMPAIMLLVVAVLAYLFINRTIYGRYLLALGRNEQAARFSGVNTDSMIVLAYVLCSTLAGVAGVLFALDINSVQPSTHGNVYELYAIAAAVLGGCSLRGGEASVVGVVIGAGLMQVLNNAINLIAWIPKQSEAIVIGGVILVGALADEIVRTVGARRRARQEARLVEN